MAKHTYKASVVIIVYNQCDSLKKVMKGISKQTMSQEDFEVIVIDDGSTDETSSFTNESDCFQGISNLIFKHYPNRGRAVARNSGIELASGEVIVFCDGDRVPAPDYIDEHYKMHSIGNDVVVGASYDFFGQLVLLEDSQLDWATIHKRSRLPSYYRRITKIYDEDGNTNSEYAYLSLLIGNSSINKDKLVEVRGFFDGFREWGFEHFELGLRLVRLGAKFAVNHDAKNYHIPHSREQNFYMDQILKNIEFFSLIHKDIDCSILYQLLVKNKRVDELVEAE